MTSGARKGTCIIAVMWRVGAIALVAAAACSDPSIELSFDVPDRYEDRVEVVVLRVIVPPASIEIDCDRLAFGEVDADTLAAATVEEVLSREGSIELTGVPREGRKLFWFEARDGEDLAVAAACGELGTTDEDASLDLVGEPATVVTATPINQLGGAPFPATITVAVSDVDAEPIFDAEIRYDIVGPAGASSSGSGTTTSSGTFVLSPEAPTTPGPAALTVRTRWSRSSNPRFLAYEPAPIALSLVLPSGADRPNVIDPSYTFTTGRFGPGGEPGFAALGQSETDVTIINQERRVVVGYYNGNNWVTSTSDPIQGALSISHVDRGTRDQPFVIAPAGWIEIAPNGGLTTFSVPFSLGPLDRVTRMLPAGGCSNEDPPHSQVFVGTGDNDLYVVDSDRQLATGEVADALGAAEAPTAAFVASGCVAGADDEAHRTIVFRDGDNTGFVAFMDQPRLGGLPVSSSVVGFAPAVGGQSARLVAVSLQLSGTTITRLRLVPLTEGMATAEITDENPTPTAPISLTGGDLDGDDQTDVASVVILGGTRDDPLTRLLVSLGIEIDGEALSGLSEELVVGANPRVSMLDYDGDGDDDVILVSESQINVLEMGPP